MFIVLFLICSVFVALYVHLTWNFNYWKKRGVDGPKPLPYLGNFPLSACFRKNISYEMVDIYRKYQVSTSFVGVFYHQLPRLLILDPKVIKDIMVTNFKDIHINEDFSEMSKDQDPLFSRNPFLTQGAEWKESRTAITPAISISKIRQIFPIIVETCRKMNEYIDSNQKNGVDAKDLSSRFTADVICNSLFGLEPNTFSESSEFLDGANALFKSGPLDYLYKTIFTLFGFLTHLFPFRFFPKKPTNWFIEFTKYALETRKSHNIQRDDFLDYLIKLQEKKSLELIDVAAHAFTLFLDSFETSSIILAHVLYQLAQNEDCQQKLRNEINKFGTLNLDELTEMPYLDNIFNETLRLTPTPFIMNKTCATDVTLKNLNGKEILLERGTVLQIPSYAIHTDSKYYADPLKFDPDRFDERNGGVKWYKDQGIFLPFGNGPRICLGMQFGTIQIKAAIFAIVKNYHITTDAPKNIEFKKNFFLVFETEAINLFFRKVK